MGADTAALPCACSPEFRQYEHPTPVLPAPSLAHCALHKKPEVSSNRRKWTQHPLQRSSVHGAGATTAYLQRNLRGNCRLYFSFATCKLQH